VSPESSTLRTISRFSSRDLRLQLAGLLDGDDRGGLAGRGSDALNGLDDVEALDDLSEDNVLAVQP
jgi:hypothetical protein